MLKLRLLHRPGLTAAPVSSPEAGAVGVSWSNPVSRKPHPDVTLSIELDDQEVRVVRRNTTQPMRSIKGHRRGRSPQTTFPAACTPSWGPRLPSRSPRRAC